MCRVLSVSGSGYYAWRRRSPSACSQANEALLRQIRQVHEQSDQTYGSPRVYYELRGQGIPCSENRVARLMRLHRITPPMVRRFVCTTDSKHRLPVAENVLARQFVPASVNQHWAGDITYIWTQQGWLYLAVVLDLYSRRVIGWSMSTRLERTLVLDALKMAIGGRRPAVGVLHHSDRGSQYASDDYQELLQRFSMVGSMSRRGNCWDNAPVESFFASLKRERVHRHRYRTRQEARADVFDYIEVWYNRRRRHSALGYLSPVAYEQQLQATAQPRAA